MITVEVLTQNPLYILKDTNCISIKKRAKKERTETPEQMKQFYIQKIIEEHSTIEWIDFRIVDDNCRGDIASHIVRQTKGHPRFVVSSSRPDWNKGEKRKPLDETYICFTSKWNLYSWTQMCRQRLCKRASLIDQQWVKSIIKIMRDSDDPLLQAIAFCSVPNCVYRHSCPESRTCGYFLKTQDDIITEFKFHNDYRNKYEMKEKLC